jgi:hypothetical protein
MSDPTATPSAFSDPPSHPSVAVVIVARRGGEVLNAAAQSLAAVSRTYGLQVLALVPTEPGTSAGPGGLSLNIRVIPVDPHEDPARWRERALADTNADVLEFVDDDAAARVAWDEVAPLRLGLVRMDLVGGMDIQETLRAEGVPEPVGSRAGSA